MVDAEHTDTDWIPGALHRLRCRCPQRLESWVKVVKRKHAAIPSGMHAAIRLAREICKPCRAITAGDGFAADGGHYWPGGASSVILALAWARDCAEECPTLLDPYLFAAVIDVGWRTPHECGSRPWLDAVEAAWLREAATLPVGTQRAG